MISIIKYISESLTHDEEGINPGNRILRATRNYWTPIRGKKDVQEARDSEANAQTNFWSSKLKTARDEANKAKEEVSKAKDEASRAKENIGGAEAAGIAAQKGAQATGEAAGSFGKKAMEFAGEHPAAAAAAAGLGIGAILRKRKQQSNN